MHLPFGTGDWKRAFADEAEIPLVNRYFEQDPVPLDGEAALLARPGLRRWINLGVGPIRGVYSQFGAFSDALFVVNHTALNRIDPNETVTLVGSAINGSPYNFVSMAATNTHLFVADGSTLWVYTDNAYAQGTLTASGVIANGEQVRIGAVYYQFASGDVNAGAPAGTAGNPWLVAMGSSTSAALDNLAAAIEGGGAAGTDYSLTLTAHTQVTTVSVTSTVLKVRAIDAGAGGNAITTTETGVNLAWGGGTLTGGGQTSFTTVAMPDNTGAIWVDVLAGHVIVVPTQVAGKKGRFYWIEPGETEIDALNFATAERAPDQLYAAVTFGDQCWMFGSGTTEAWYATGDGLAPFQRVQGRVFDHGVWEGTPVKFKQAMIVVDRDGVVWDISGGVERISNHGIEQRIRESMTEQIRWS